MICLPIFAYQTVVTFATCLKFAHHKCRNTNRKHSLALNCLPSKDKVYPLSSKTLYSAMEKKAKIRYHSK